MNKVLSKLRTLLRVQYRLTVLYNGETKPRDTYGMNGRLLRRMARNTEDISTYWSPYKSGPFFLPEREVDSYTKGAEDEHLPLLLFLYTDLQKLF